MPRLKRRIGQDTAPEGRFRIGCGEGRPGGVRLRGRGSADGTCWRLRRQDPDQREGNTVTRAGTPRAARDFPTLRCLPADREARRRSQSQPGLERLSG